MNTKSIFSSTEDFFLSSIRRIHLQVVNLRADPSLVEGYIKEVKILASLQDKLNVIRLYE